MDILGLFGPIIGVTLISFRVGAFWFAFPFVMSINIPSTVKIAGAMAISVALYPMVKDTLPAWSLAQMPELYEFVAYAAKEFIIGIGLGFTAKFIFSSAVAAATWVGMQMGFSMGGIVDPNMMESDTTWGAFHSWMALMIYLALGGHWFTIQALSESFTFSFDQLWQNIGTAGMGIAMWSELGTRFFTWMLKLAGPLMAVVLLMQAGMGMLSKFVPQINVWMVSIPVTLGVGVLVFSLLLPTYAEALKAMFDVGSETQYLWLRYLGAR